MATATVKRDKGVAVRKPRAGRRVPARTAAHEGRLLQRITYNPAVLGGKPIIRGRRLAVEHVLEMLAVGDTEAEILAAHPWLEPEDVQACLLFAARTVGSESTEPVLAKASA